MKNNDIGRKIAFVMTCLLCLILVGALELVSVGFDPTRLEEPSFWIKLTCNLFANYLILFSSAEEDITKSYKINNEIIERKAEVDGLVKKELYPDFDDYIALDNKQRKINAWKEYISKQITKLESKATLEDNEVFWYGDKKAKEASKYCKKRKQLEYKMSDEYIKRNILYISIKYYKIKRQVITTGCEQNSDEYRPEEHRARRIIRDNKNRFLISSAFIIAISTLIPDFKHFTIVTLVLVVSKILTLVWNLFSGKNYAVYYQNNVIIPDFQFRKDYITKYVDWRVHNK